MKYIPGYIFLFFRREIDWSNEKSNIVSVRRNVNLGITQYSILQCSMVLANSDPNETLFLYVFNQSEFVIDRPHPERQR